MDKYLTQAKSNLLKGINVIEAVMKDDKNFVIDISADQTKIINEVLKFQGETGQTGGDSPLINILKVGGEGSADVNLGSPEMRTIDFTRSLFVHHHSKVSRAGSSSSLSHTESRQSIRGVRYDTSSSPGKELPDEQSMGPKISSLLP
mmetsp:Transcript_19028/g.29176  ORF Transcript_19028/g.29176 Transcript_19028/m.29176 type:complete len:147 (+) Transcript_19028:95-535(+)|eukprot:CAMPEP_0170499028 /NCGR_PEP_ID=MMETSP0208-20121228/29818_1 /TAXON_ID=197538 /ORGANISM="Strombidium inclinatum, Strain S3" /LENGTH=146 /DNA_ID=CAMNT_0010776405 /DNA_START=78 /DNA_END=518 /DNA_ORIENTATION=+